MEARFIAGQNPKSDSKSGAQSFRSPPRKARRITGRAGVYNVEPAVNRQPGVRRELVEQITSFIILSRNFLHGELLKCKFPDPGVFDTNFRRNSKISSFFQHFGEEAAGLFDQGLIDHQS